MRNFALGKCLRQSRRLIDNPNDNQPNSTNYTKKDYNNLII